MNGLPADHPILKQAVAAMTTAERAHQLMADWGLIEDGWRFRISKTKTTVGRCFYHDKVIEFSEYFLDNEWEKIEDNILHEIAHALSYLRYGNEGKGHGNLWKTTCIEVGANPTRVAHGSKRKVSSAQHVYEIYCTDCGSLVGRRHRLKTALLARYQSKCCSAKLEAREK